MKDSAAGSISGFLFQFEKALLMLAELKKPNDAISFENVDDIAQHDGQDIDKIIYAVQAKNSLLATGTTFGDTSESLWRTLEIWVTKFEEGVFDEGTSFVCATNKTIPDDALIRKLRSLSFEQAIQEIEQLLQTLEQKAADKRSSGKGSPSISAIVTKIKALLKHQPTLAKIFPRLVIEDGEQVKAKLIDLLRLNVDRISDAAKDQIYESLCGWFSFGCYAKWKDGEKAVFTKKMFDTKFFLINSSPQILNAIFRKKDDLQTLAPAKKEKIRDELFYKQIDDIDRGLGKKRILEKAMADFLYHEIEMSHVIQQGNYTEQDFDKFQEKCGGRWQDLFDEYVIRANYTEEEQNTLAITIYDAIMNEDQLKFDDGIEFNLENRYIKNGSFLKLSNTPKIGWRPDWESKYK